MLLFDVTKICALTVLSVLFSVEMSGHDMVCFDKTFEAAEALLHMESPGGLHSERNTGKHTTKYFLACLIDTGIYKLYRQ